MDIPFQFPDCCFPLMFYREGAYFLITDQLSGKSQQILSDLHSQQESLFLYLKTVIEIQTTGSLNLSCLKKADVSDIPNSRRAHKKLMDVEAYLVAISNSLNHLRNNEVHVTNEMTELYFEVKISGTHRCSLWSLAFILVFRR